MVQLMYMNTEQKKRHLALERITRENHGRKSDEYIATHANHQDT